VIKAAILGEINARLTWPLLGINGKLEYPREFVLKRLPVGNFQANF
jgi:hypothetical protein